MARGRFITFEGGEGAGKSSQVRLLEARLTAAGRTVVRTREPGGSPGAEAIRALLVTGDPDRWSPLTETLLMYAARRDHVERVIAPALARGDWVICDRFADSTRAYQGGGGGLDDGDILTLHDLGSRGLLPDLTLVIVAPDDAVSERLAARDGGMSDAIGGRAAEYHSRVCEAFVRFAEAEPGRFALIDGGGTPEQVHARIVAAVAPLIGARP